MNSFVSTHSASVCALLTQSQIDKFWAQLHSSLHFTPLLAVVALCAILCAGIFCYVQLSSAPHTHLRVALAHLALFTYLAFILHLQIFSRTAVETAHIELVPFQWYTNGILHESRVVSACANFLLFVPYGFLLKNKHLPFRKCLSIVFMTSFFCEAVQYLAKLGTFKTENLITTVLGGCLGYVCYDLITRALCKRKNAAAPAKAPAASVSTE